MNSTEQHTKEFLKQTAEDYCLSYNTVRSIYKQSANHAEYYKKLEELLQEEANK